MDLGVPTFNWRAPPTGIQPFKERRKLDLLVRQIVFLNDFLPWRTGSNHFRNQPRLNSRARKDRFATGYAGDDLDHIPQLFYGS